MLLNTEQMLSYLRDQQHQDIMLLIKEYPSLFADTPSQTTIDFVPTTARLIVLQNPILSLCPVWKTA